ncbi:MAG TPA: DUF1700 domain-containing protein [Syntrophomonadaceae bacterium]|nr:DUF1700 domain-containing protein [Syntrophomonadaceae bacterium]
MNKIEFLKKFDIALTELPTNLRLELLSKYDDMITTNLEQGMTEEEVLTSLDSPEALAQYYIVEYLLDTAEKDLTLSNLFKVIKITLKLGISNLLLLIGPILGITGALLALLGASFSTILSGFSLLIGVFIRPFTVFSYTIPQFFYESSISAIGTFFLSFGLIAFGLLFLIGSYIFTRIFIRGTLKHLRFHLLEERGFSKRIFPHRNFKKSITWLTLIIFTCFLLAVIFFLTGGDNWFISN